MKNIISEEMKTAQCKRVRVWNQGLRKMMSSKTRLGLFLGDTENY